MQTLSTNKYKLYGLFFLSGATALIYQVVWTKLLTLFFGSTMLAVSTVLATFMCGLAIGSALIGRKADAVRRPVRIYAWLELFIGLFAIATPLIFSAIGKIYVYIHSAQASGFWEAAMLRFLLSMLLLLPPTIMMGGTLPVLSKVFFDNKTENTGKALSLLYFINTAGAVTGTIASGLFLLQSMGINLLLLASGLINIGIFVMAYKIQVQESKPALGPAESDAAVSGWSASALLAAAALFFSGLCALIYEVVWTRVLTLIIGSSTYAFTVMLATFLAGIALGSAVVSRISYSRDRGISLLALCQALIGLFAIVTAAFFGLLPEAFVRLFAATGETFSVFLTAQALLCFVVMVPATIFMGASFPIAGSIVVERFGTSGRRIGFLYAGNTIGAIIGAFIAGFVLLPRLNIHGTLLLTIMINLGCAIALAVFSLKKKRLKSDTALAAVSASFMLLLLFVWQPEWDKQKMTSGPYAYAVQYQNTSIKDRLSKTELLFYKEGPIATVAVRKEGKHVRLAVDGKTDAGNFRDMTTQALIAHLPLVLKPDSKDVLVIGFASGITAGAVARHDVNSIDCVEIEPAMKEASAFFEQENYNIMKDKRFNLVLDDGRSYVLTTKKKYDLIISEPSNPWQAGSSRLFTREAFVNAKNVLKPDGMMVQWMHLYGTSVESLKLVARTFLSVFPHTTFWMDPEFADVIFVGSMKELPFSPVALEKIFKEHPEVRDSMSRIGYTEDWTIMKAFLLGESELTRFAGNGEINTDNLPLLEYRAPKSLYLSTALNDNVIELYKNKSQESFPAVSVTAGEKVQAAGLLGRWGEALAKSNLPANAKGALLRSTELNPDNYLTYLQLGYLRMLTKDLYGAIQSYQTAVKLNPGAGSAYANLGILFYQTGRIDDAYSSFRNAVSHGEDSPNLRNNLSVILAKQGKLEEALIEIKRALALNPADEVALKNLNEFQRMLNNKR